MRVTTQELFFGDKMEAFRLARVLCASFFFGVILNVNIKQEPNNHQAL